MWLTPHYTLPVTLNTHTWINARLPWANHFQYKCVPSEGEPASDTTQHTEHLLVKTSTPRGLSSTLPNRHDQSYKTWQGLPVDVQRVRRRDNTRHPPGGPGEPLSTVAAPPNTETTMEGTKPPSPSMCFIFHHTPTLMLSKCMATVRLHSFRRQKAATKIIPSPKCTSVPKPLVNTQEKSKPNIKA